MPSSETSTYSGELLKTQKYAKPMNILHYPYRAYARRSDTKTGIATSKKPRSRERMSPQEKGIHKVSREPSCRARKSKQSPYRRTKIIERVVLSAKDRMRSSWLTGVPC